MSEETIDPTFPIPGDVQILVEKDETLQKTESGIIIAEMTPNANAPQIAYTPIGIVKAVGCNLKREFRVDINSEEGTTKKRTLKVGDRIYYNRYANLTLTHKGQSFLLMGEIDAYCLIPSTETVVTTLKQKPQARPNIDRNEFRKKVGLDKDEDLSIDKEMD